MNLSEKNINDFLTTLVKIIEEKEDITIKFKIKKVPLMTKELTKNNYIK